MGTWDRWSGRAGDGAVMGDLAVGVDVGGTKIAAGVVDGEGRILRHERRQSPAADSRAMSRAICEMVRDLAVDHEISAVGVAAAGFVDAGRSVVRYAPNLAWHDVALRVDLERELGLRVIVENDANAAAWGEFQFGAAKDARHLLMVTVGTGVGGGIVVDGSLLRGAFGSAAEIGHIRVVPGGLPCGCGNLGCWEQYASGSALVRTTRAQATEDPQAAALLELAGGDPAALTGPMVTRAAAAGDPFAVARLEELGRWLGEGLATLSAVLDPELILVGGGVSEAGDLLLEPAREAFRLHQSAAGHHPEATIALASLGNGAGVIGAADLGRLP